MQPELAVNVFWDLENCAVPSYMKGIHVVNAIRSFALQRGVLKNISAFANLKLIKDELRSNLQECGVLLHDVSRNKSNASDIAILVEILKLVIDNKPPHCIVLISGDRDFSNVLNTLTFRRYQVFLIHSTHASDVLKYSATAAYEWFSLLKAEEVDLDSTSESSAEEKDSSGGNSPYIIRSTSADKISTIVGDDGTGGAEQLDIDNNIFINNTTLIDPLNSPRYTAESAIGDDEEFNDDDIEENSSMGIYEVDDDDHYYYPDASESLDSSGDKDVNQPLVLLNNSHNQHYGTVISCFYPLLDLLDRSESKKLTFSEIGIKLQFPKLGYTKLNNYLYDAQELGLISIKQIRQIFWAFPRCTLENPLAIDLSKSFRKIFTNLLSTLDSLKTDYFRPTESQILKRMKTLELPCYNFDVILVPVALSNSLLVEGEKPNRLIYPPTGRYEGLDPSNPNPDYFSPHTWNLLEDFLKSVHPVSKVS
eukprot:gene17471-20846_t